MKFLILLCVLYPPCQAAELWQCGPDQLGPVRAITGSIIQSHCGPEVSDYFNVCCIRHDNCYTNAWPPRNLTREACDMQLCHCVQAAAYFRRHHDCNAMARKVCAVVSSPVGHPSYVFSLSGSNRMNDLLELIDDDYRPMSIDLPKLARVCDESGYLVAQCQATLKRCLKGDHERSKRTREDQSERNPTSISNNSLLAYQDCRAALYECIQDVRDEDPREECKALTTEMMETLLSKYRSEDYPLPDAIKAIHPVISGRLLFSCTALRGFLYRCLKEFDVCVTSPGGRNTSDFYQLRNSVSAQCNFKYWTCLRANIDDSNAEPTCLEAFTLANRRIYKKKFEEPERVTDLLVQEIEQESRRLIERVGSSFVKEAKKTGEYLQKTGNEIGHSLSTGAKKIGKFFWNIFG